MCMNKIDDDAMPAIERVLSQTPDDFGITLSGNPISTPVVKHIHQTIKGLHKKRVQDQKAADPSNNQMLQELEDIH